MNGYLARVDIHGETLTKNDPARRIPYSRASIGCGGRFWEVGVSIHCLCPSLRPGARHPGRFPAHCLLQAYAPRMLFIESKMDLTVLLPIISRARRAVRFRAAYPS
jgi:hypothetical protein